MNRMLYLALNAIVIVLFFVFYKTEPVISFLALPIAFIILDWLRRRYLKMPPRPFNPFSKKYWTWLKDLHIKK